MPVLNIIDTETDGADNIKELVRSLFAMGTPSDPPPVSGLHSYEASVPVYINEGTRIVLRQKIELNFSSFPESNSVINSVQEAQYLSHKVRIQTPDTDMSASSFNYNNYSSDAFSYYNLKFVDYERYTQVANERSLPNFLIGALYQRSFAAEQENLYTMFGSQPSLTSTLLLAPATPINNYEFDGQFLGREDYDAALRTDYFRIFYENRLTSSAQYEEAGQNVYVDYRYNLNDSAQIGNCPFFNRIRLPKTGPLVFSPLVDSLDTSEMSDVLLKTFRQSNSFPRSFNINGNQADLKVYDLLDEIEAVGLRTISKESDEMFLRTKEQKHISDMQTPFLFYFYKLLAIGKLRTLAKSNLLDFEALIAQNESHKKEHIGFKVVKRIQGRITPLQTFYFLSDKTLDDFIDTQIRFDRVYTYQVIAMYAIYGSNYSYETVSSTINNSGGTTVSMYFVNRPSLKIVEVPFANHTLRVVEPPPITPEITFYNEKTSKNKVKIRLEHQDGNIVSEFSPLRAPMRVFGDNQQYIDKLKQYFSSEDILVTSGKTSSGQYEIYRLDEAPKDYSDFEGNLIASVQSGVMYSNGERSKSVMFTDYIRHQKKYYYMFRTLTHNLNPSETSEIYQIEMYEDADETFLLVNMYNFPEPDVFDNSISMRKFIQIIPNFEHTLIEESQFDEYPSAEDAIKELQLGSLNLQEGLWTYKDKESKYIKLRLESKSSGRKLDLNLLFKIIKPN